MNEISACLYLVACYYDKACDAEDFCKRLKLGKEPASFGAIGKAAENVGFRSRCIELTYSQLKESNFLPCIVQSGTGRFVVLLPRSRWKNRSKIECIDAASNVIRYSEDEFNGTALLLERTFRFGSKEKGERNKPGWRLVLKYLRRSHDLITKLIVSFIVTSGIQLLLPFLMQSIVDVGITTQNLSFIKVILIAQATLVISRIMVDIVRARLLMLTSNILILPILSDFWIKLMKLPFAYFDRQHSGDILQRLNDNWVVQNFLTGSTLNTLQSLLNFAVFGVVLVIYNAKLFLVYGIGVVLYVVWVRLFFNIRRKINYRIFFTSSRENTMTLQLVQGMQEIRLQNIEQKKRWEWENITTAIFNLNLKRLTYAQVQQTGSVLINQGKDIVLTFLVARAVIEGHLTLGAMMAIQYIIGQLSGPVDQFIGFVQMAQDAKISMERLNDIHNMEEEEKPHQEYLFHLPAHRTISIRNLSFSYAGKGVEPVLKNIQFDIPQGKTTAIVGMSGSGKTSLIKLLLKFYENYEGQIKIGEFDLRNINSAFWRSQCAAVMQSSFIFNDSIANNIAMRPGSIDRESLIEACRISNILSFIESLPDKFNTRIGAEGVGISQGQRQRLLIARAIYSNPQYLFFDESTSALDMKNEKCIFENLAPFLKKKTVIIVAHRLSTVINADNIIVFNQGEVIEQGNHAELSMLKGEYFELIKNQLEFGN